MKATFEEAYKLYSDLRKKVDYSGTTEELEKQFPLLKPAYDKLGDEVVKYLKYVQKRIREQLICNNDTTTINNKIRSLQRYYLIVTGGRYCPSVSLKIRNKEYNNE